MKTFFSTFIIAFSLLALNACVKESENENPLPQVNPLAGLLKIGEANITGSGARAVVYANDSLTSGYNELFVQLFDTATGAQLKNGHFTITPMMDMGAMKHSSPVENSDNATPLNGIFKTIVVFSMPGDASQWSLNMHLHNHANNKEGDGQLPIAVRASSPSRIINTLMANDGDTKVLISWAQPVKPKTGSNDFELLVHKKESMMSYPAVEDYTFEIEPYMPSMGHGSPNNVNPVHIEKGHYRGKVNFTMTGEWQIKLKVYKNGVLLRDDLMFETRF
ncbi:MAG: FixH family protein [Bacteroidia bacterium]|nr:FixH family protein [Bacteroidia bacterium]MCC6768009.1 FixH family protein [Bacteroidia bacterium]